MSGLGYDIAIIGGGIIGLATALELSTRYPRYKTVVLEKEAELATHQTGHNSGVIHSGIYYRPGSLKARNCVAGGRALLEFCRDNGVEYQMCGKVIVAVDRSELAGLDELYRRGIANGVPGLRMIEAEELRELEPYASGVKALHSPNTGIIDYTQVALAYANRFRDNGGEVVTGARVMAIRQTDGLVSISTAKGDVRAKSVINCAGLYSDAIARMMGVKQDVRIVPFRGEYYMLSPEASHMVRGLIYPVPNPEFPFLGVHFTRTVHGDVEAGPNAVLAFAREGIQDDAGQRGGDPGNPGLSRFLGHVRQVLEDGHVGDVSLPQQEGLCHLPSTTCAGHSGEPPREGRRRSARPGGGKERPDDGRLSHHRDSERHSRKERSLSGSNGLPGHWQGRGGRRGKVVPAGVEGPRAHQERRRRFARPYPFA